MLGAVAGDIIGSPFEWMNTSDEGFELCRSHQGIRHGRSVASHPHFTDDTVMTLAVARWLMKDKECTGRSLVGCITDLASRYPKAGYSPSFMRWLQSEYHNPLSNYGYGSAIRVSPVGLMVDDLSDVMRIAAVSAQVSHNHPDGIKGAQAVAQAVWMARMGRSKDDIHFAMTHDFGYDLDMEIDTLRALLRGCVPEPVVVNGQDSGLLYYRETGVANSSADINVTAALRAFMETDGFGPAVKRAVSLGGKSDTVASICGAIAAPFYGGVPEAISHICDHYLDMELRSLMSSFEAQSKRTARNETVSVTQRPSDALSVIRTEGQNPVFVVEKGRKDIIRCIREKFGQDACIIEPKNLRRTLKSMKEEPREGTYIAGPRPDVRPLRFENGQLRGPLTYNGPDAAPLSQRQAAYSAMQDVIGYARQVKRELQRQSGFAEDGDIRYEHAYYPVIYHNRVDIFQGPYLDGSVSFDEYQGRMHILEDGEMREGEYINADWCRERVFDVRHSYLDAASVKAAIGRFCLDEGVGIHDLQRRSNISTAQEDLATSRDPRINPPLPQEQRRSSIRI